MNDFHASDDRRFHPSPPPCPPRRRLITNARYDYTWTDNRMWRKTRMPNPNSILGCVGTDPNRNW